MSPTRLPTVSPAPVRPKVWLSPSPHFRAQGYELHDGLLDEAAIKALLGMPLGVTKPINGEAARRQRPLEAGITTHTHVLRCVDTFLSARDLLASEPSVLVSMSDAKRQRSHRDRGQGSLIASFHDGTHICIHARIQLPDYRVRLAPCSPVPACEPLRVDRGGAGLPFAARKRPK